MHYKAFIRDHKSLFTVKISCNPMILSLHSTWEDIKIIQKSTISNHKILSNIEEQ